MMIKSKSAYERGNSQTKLWKKWFVTMLSFSVFCRSIQSDIFLRWEFCQLFSDDSNAIHALLAS